MRSAILLLSLLCAVAVLAVKDDVACVVHSDDCGRCTSNGCNWCSDGYCVSKESDICEAHKVATECNVLPAQPISHQQRQTIVCEAILNSCAACGAVPGCSRCREPISGIEKCSGSSSCLPSIYNAGYESWIAPAGLASRTFSSVSTCAPVLIPAANSPTLVFTLSGINVVLPSGAFAHALLIGPILSFLATIFGSQNTFTAANIIIIGVTLNPPLNKRQSIDPTTRSATILVKFADAPGATAQGVAATLLANPVSSSVPLPVLAPNSVAVTAAPYTAGAGTGAVISSTGNVVNRGGNSGVDLSKGALAGIIIGCVIGGALIVALIAFLILRRRDAYPQAFRSPAAAYRP